MNHSADPERAALLEALGTTPAALLGRGGEAAVYALDKDRVVRIHHPGTAPEVVRGRAALLAELGRSAGRVKFAIPEVLDLDERNGRVLSVERRLPGRPVMEWLHELTGKARAQLIRAYLETAAAIGDLHLERPWFGEVLDRSDAIRTERFRDYLAGRSARSLAAAGPDFAGVEPAALAAALPEPAARSLVHLDAFPGNMLADSSAITAVIDFGAVTLMGDRRLDPLAAAAYLTPHITPAATAADRRVAAEWLAERGLAAWFEPAKRWLAAFWAFASDDVRLHSWCRSVLLQ